MQFLSTIDNLLYNKITMRSPYHTGRVHEQLVREKDEASSAIG
jgi:hypothetical protein